MTKFMPVPGNLPLDGSNATRRLSNDPRSIFRLLDEPRFGDMPIRPVLMQNPRAHGEPEERILRKEHHRVLDFAVREYGCSDCDKCVVVLVGDSPFEYLDLCGMPALWHWDLSMRSSAVPYFPLHLARSADGLDGERTQCSRIVQITDAVPARQVITVLPEDDGQAVARGSRAPAQRIGRTCTTRGPIKSAAARGRIHR